MKPSTVLPQLLMLLVGSSVLLAVEAHDNAVQQIEESGGFVRPIASNDQRVAVGFQLLRDNFNDSMLEPTANLSNVYEIRLGNTPLTSAGLAYIVNLDSIERLYLEKTKIDDAGLAHLRDLRNLAHLNIYGTAVTDAGLEHLAGLTNLEQLYLWQTQVTDEGVAKLQAALPDLVINRGWE
jgi:hypothetical protein